jgi:hypothetical protein
VSQRLCADDSILPKDLGWQEWLSTGNQAETKSLRDGPFSRNSIRVGTTQAGGYRDENLASWKKKSSRGDRERDNEIAAFKTPLT